MHTSPLLFLPGQAQGWKTDGNQKGEEISLDHPDHLPKSSVSGRELTWVRLQSLICVGSSINLHKQTMQIPHKPAAWSQRLVTPCPTGAMLAAHGGQHGPPLPPPSLARGGGGQPPWGIWVCEINILLSCPLSASVAALTLAQGHRFPVGPSRSQELAQRDSPLFMVHPLGCEMFPLLFPVPLNWIWVKQQIRGLWLWLGRAGSSLLPSPEHRQASMPTRPQSTKTSMIPVHLKNAKLVLDSENPFPRILLLLFCVLSISSMTFFSFFFSHPSRISFLQLDHEGATYALSTAQKAKAPSSVVSWALVSRAFQRALGRKGILEKHPEEEWRELRVSHSNCQFKACSLSLKLVFCLFVCFPSLAFRAKIYYFQVNPLALKNSQAALDTWKGSLVGVLLH